VNRLGNSRVRTTDVVAIGIASLIAALVAFGGSVGAVPDAGSDPDFGAGYSVGQGLFYGLLVWPVMHFLALRGSSRKAKWGGFGVLFICTLAGAAAGASI